MVSLGGLPRSQMAPGLAVLQSVLYYLTLPMYFVVAWVLYRRGLWASYRYFWAGIIVEGISVAVEVATAGLKGYQKMIYLTVQPVIYVFYVLMVIEVFRKVFVRFPGIARFAQRVIVVSMVVAFAFAIATLGGEVHQKFSVVQWYSVALRAISTALWVYLILIAAFLVWMPVPLARNSIRHSVLFFFYFMSASAVHYRLNIGDQTFYRMANLFISAITLLALISWAWLLKPDGEIAPTNPATPRSGVSTLLNRLESINKSLSPPEE